MPPKRPHHEERDAYLKKAFGVTYDWFLKQLAHQGNVCPVCDGTPVRESQWAVHHDHSTGKIIALVCRDCNSGMGLLGDNPAWLRKAARLISESRRSDNGGPMSDAKKEAARNRRWAARRARRKEMEEKEKAQTAGKLTFSSDVREKR